MLSNLFTRRAFAGRFATLVSGLGLAAASAPAAEPKKEASGGVKKMDFDGKPAGPGFITPLITFNDVIYIAGIGAHSHDQSEFPMDIDTHTKTNAIRLHHSKLNKDNSLAKPDELLRMDDEPGHDELCEREQLFLLNAIRKNVDLEDHMNDAVNSLRVVLAADESIKNKKVVTLR